MKIKNVNLLRNRARWHAKEGHVKQGTYGGGRVNGSAEFKGCFVGCLATPHRKSELIAFLREHLTLPAYLYSRPPGADKRLDEAIVDQQHGLLVKTFGLTPPLIAAIEAFFESQPTHAEAIDFVPAVARALNEGADISPSDVRRYWRGRFPGSNAVGATVDLETGEERPALYREFYTPTYGTGAGEVCRAEVDHSDASERILAPLN